MASLFLRSVLLCSAQRFAASSEAALRASLAPLLEGGGGRLGPAAARGALHQHFIQERGWSFRGLRLPGGARDPTPPRLQELVTSLTPATSADLHVVVGVADALEGLVRQEEGERIEQAYRALGLNLEIPLSEEEAEELMDAYMLIYVTGGEVPLHSPQAVRKAKAKLAASRPSWPRTLEWLDELRQRTEINSENGTGTFDATAARALAREISEQYVTFNDVQCDGLKQLLLDGEFAEKMGRVALPDFYKKGLDSEWHLDERAEYLRALGALDESKPSQPRVIVPNYIESEANCLQVSELYSICCRSECAPLIDAVERSLGVQSANPKRIVEIVEDLPSDSEQFPRRLSAGLVERLGQIAAAHGGTIPLHGRLFAEWMHQAFPAECPQPHRLVAGRYQPAEVEKTEGEETALPLGERREIVAGVTRACSGAGCLSKEDQHEEEAQIFWEPTEVTDNAGVAAERWWWMPAGFVCFTVLGVGYRLSASGGIQEAKKIV